ncbi:MAG TPA: hypothetical protein VMT18_02800 [Planctomycetota bacterium]|nr:hypothetical protein [Planctomycetota bacterium]
MSTVSRTLTLIALLLPGLILSGAPQLTVCLSEALGLEMPCGPLAAADCCGAASEGPTAVDAPDCGVCCITIEVAEPLVAAPAPESVASALLELAAPPLVLLATLPASARTLAPARAAPPLVRPPGRAPIPLRI